MPRGVRHGPISAAYGDSVAGPLLNPILSAKGAGHIDPQKGMGMAEHGRTLYATAPGNDYAEHESTYTNVMKLAKVGTIIVIGVVVALGIFGTTGSTFWTAAGIVLSIVAGIVGSARNSGLPGGLVIVFLLFVWALLI
jgi:hypothetical protein